LWWAWSGELPFGELPGAEGDDGLIFGFAVCRYDQSGALYRFTCNKHWQVVQDMDHGDEEEAKADIPGQYDASRVVWQRYIAQPGAAPERYQTEYLTREQAIANAREQASRDMSESESVISYVAFVPEVDDFCLCEFRFEAPHGWLRSFRMLKPAERKPDEKITDDRIRAVAQAGDVLSAIRLYRGKYGVGLFEAKAEVERLHGSLREALDAIRARQMDGLGGQR